MNPSIRTALIAAGLILGGAVLLRLWAHTQPLASQAEITQRGINVLIALMVILNANTAAKQIRAMPRCDPALEQAARRFTSFALVIGGALYALAWLIAPLNWAFPLSITALGGATVAGVVRCLTLWSRRPA